MKTYGKYVSRKLIKGESLAFEGKFEKAQKVKISVNFMKEEGAYKIMQIQFAPM